MIKRTRLNGKTFQACHIHRTNPLLSGCIHNNDCRKKLVVKEEEIKPHITTFDQEIGLAGKWKEAGDEE
ncbi:hypothetical protein [Thalassobacillus devorans]|uniref:hypothetical protein n=1 Tax=Thalassobacillus devorans TaxID=279813 RepID=UPI00048F60D7|nr:hypothetical protein [Thalassobacillus devorans]